MWKPKNIIFPRKVNNLQNSFACSQNYTEYVLNIIKLDILLVLFLVGYLNIILIPEATKVLKDTLDLSELIRWVGCWLYMACWVGIPESLIWWPVTPPMIRRRYPFRLNKYISCHCFDEILVSLRYTNRGVYY